MKRRNRLIEQIQYRLRRSYGMDRLNTHLLVLMIVILVLGLFVKNSIPALLAFVIFGIFVYRFISINITKRSIENRKYQDINRYIQDSLKRFKIMLRIKSISTLYVNVAINLYVFLGVRERLSFIVHTVNKSFLRKAKSLPVFID